MNMMYWNAMGFFGWTMMIVFWVAVVALIVWAVRSTASTRRREPDPIDILERRFALGEIEGDEYEKRRRTLETLR
jgi:putative membrane protein